MVVNWTHSAREDLKQIHDYISRDSRVYARRVVQNIKDRIDQLTRSRDTGRIVPEMAREDIRELRIYTYRIIPHIHKETSTVLGIIHTSRDFPPTSMPIP